MAHVLLTHWVHDDTIHYLENHGHTVEINSSKETLAPQIIHQRLKKADAVMAFMPDCVDNTFLDHAPGLKIVAGALKGFDNLDLEACNKRHVMVTYVPDLLSMPTAELAVSLLLNVARNVKNGNNVMDSYQFTGWKPTLYSHGVVSKNIGIIGYGRVGQCIAQLLEGFNTHIRTTDPVHGDTELTQLLQLSDIVILAAPLTQQSYHMIDKTQLGQMKQGAILVNVGRGSTVNEHAVVDALKTQQLSFYAADVFECEDHSIDSRPHSIPPELIALKEQTCFTPHLGSAVDSVRYDISMSAAKSIVQCLDGQTPDNIINLAAI